MRGKQIFLLTWFIFFAFFSSKAQQKYDLKIISKSGDKIEHVYLNREKVDSLEIYSVTEQQLNDFHKTGFLLSKIDTIVFARDSALAVIDTNAKFKWVSLNKGNLDNQYAAYLRKDGKFDGRSFSITEIRKFQEDIIKIAQNKGYPFANIRLDSIRINNENGVSASFNYSSGPYIKFDSLTVVGNGRLKPSFLGRYFKIRRGLEFDMSRLEAAELFLSSLPSVKIERPYNILFSNYKAYPVFFLNKRASNIVDGIIGFLPNQTAGKKLLITGQVNLQLFNISGTGNSILLEWNKLQALSQSLNFQLSNLNTLNTGLDFDFKFALLKQDSAFVNLTNRLSLSKLLSNNAGKISLSTEYKNSRRNQSFVEETEDGPIDFNLISYGLSYQWQKLDNVIWPRKGTKFLIDGFAGNKKIKNISNIDSSQLSFQTSSAFQFSVSTSIQQHIKLFKKHGAFLAASSAILLGNNLFINDFYRIGGFKTIRGFNENYFFASKYVLGNLEYRYFFEQESFLLLFFDQAVIERKTKKDVLLDFPSGFGGGLNFQTKAGNVTVVYSLGRSNDSPVNFSLSKVHFGITNRF